MADFRFFKMADAAIFFGNFKFLTVETLKRVELRLRAKFCRNRLNRGRDMAIFRFFKMAAAILKNRKSAISPERFHRSSQKLVWWRILGLWMGPEVEIFNFWKSKLADGRHLEKSKNRNISAAVWAISKKFGTQTHFDPLERPNR